MRIKLAALLIAALFVASCGKKDDQPQTQTPPKDTVKTQQQQTQQKPDTTKQQTDVKKEDDKTKDADKKKDDSKKNNTDIKSDSKDSTQKTPPTQTDVDFSMLWPKKCAKCHGKDGKGKIENAPDLTGSKTKSKSEAQLLKIISNGVKADNPDDDDMPAWKGKLTDDEIKAAVKYVKGL